MGLRTVINIFTLTMWGSTLDVRIWRLQTMSENIESIIQREISGCEAWHPRPYTFTRRSTDSNELFRISRRLYQGSQQFMGTNSPSFLWLFPDECSKFHDAGIGQIHRDHPARDKKGGIFTPKKPPQPIIIIHWIWQWVMKKTTDWYHSHLLFWVSEHDKIPWYFQISSTFLHIPWLFPAWKTSISFSRFLRWLGILCYYISSPLTTLRVVYNFCEHGIKTNNLTLW